MLYSHQASHTDSADDGSAAELPLWLVLGVELRQPFDSGPAGAEMCDCVGHCDVIFVIGIGKRLRRRGGEVV